MRPQAQLLGPLLIIRIRFYTHSQNLLQEKNLKVYTLAKATLTKHICEKKFLTVCYSPCITEDAKARYQKEDIYYKAHISYGLGAIKKDWVYRNHFIDYALYMINYATSAMAAVQIMRAECENKGAGVDGFIHFINRKQGIGFTTILKEAGLANPFEEETFVKTAEFLQDFFKK